jgi:glycosyltransferase involved in cell wall biosynthesis
MQILYITQWFEPEPIVKGIVFAKAFAERGHQIEVVTGFPNYPTGKIYPGYRIGFYKREIVDGIVVHRVPLYPSHNSSSIGRILNYFSFMASAALFAAFRARRFDIIYCYPPITGGLAAIFAGWLSRRPFVIDIQDLWPDSVVKSGMAGTRRMEKILNLMCNFVYRRAARILAQSKGIKSRLIERGVSSDKISVVYNWADELAAAPAGLADLSPYGFDDKFNIVYGGNLGRVQGLDVLVRAAHLARQQSPDLQLLLIGDGIESDNLKQLVRELDAENVRIAPGVPRKMIGDVFAAADVLALHLWNDPLFRITIPQKTQFYMAMGKPILIGVEGEAAEFVTAAGAGITVPSDDVDAMADAMVRLSQMPRERLADMGRHGREAYWRTFSLAIAIAETEAAFQGVLESACGTSRSIGS